MPLLNVFWLQFADIALTGFHFSLILFNLLGWIWNPLRKWHLLSLGLTLASWFILGIWYGWGYCPITDWHWQVLHRLGHVGLPPSYISFLITRFTGLNIPHHVVDVATLSGALMSLVMAVYMQYRSYFRRNRAGKNTPT